MIKSNSCYTQYLLKMGISQAVQYNTIFSTTIFKSTESVSHIRKTFTEYRYFCIFFPQLPPPPNDKPSDLTYSGFGWGFLEGLCLSKSVRHHL